MNRYAIIDGENVINAIEYEEPISNPPPGFDAPIIAIQNDEAAPGWKYIDNKFIAPIIPPAEPFPVTIVPMWAVRTILQNDGLFDQAQAFVTASTDNALKNVWEYGNFADRNSSAIAKLAVELNLTPQQVDQMFIDANNLSV